MDSVEALSDIDFEGRSLVFDRRITAGAALYVAFYEGWAWVGLANIPGSVDPLLWSYDARAA